jgi:L-asparaginase
VARTIGIYFLGGTIAMSAAAGGGVEALLGPDELLASVPGLADLDVVLVPHDFGRVASASLQFDHLLALVRDAAASDYDGVVVVQGTDTIEEAAFLFDLLWAGDAPLVVTGAMRNPAMAGPDGPANLLAAVTVAAADAARGLGALVVFNDELHAARYVAKTHTASTATFISPAYGPLGHVVEGRVVLGMRVPRLPPFAMPEAINASVPVIPAVLGDDGALLSALDAVDGVVIAGVGGGHVSDRLVERIGGTARRIPVVLATRTGSGPVLTATYAAPGAEIDLIGRGVITAGELNAYKARLLLLMLLAHGADKGEIATAFANRT